MTASSICVFCGSATGNNPKYAQDAEQLGEIFLKNNFKLIYGGGTTGIMGILAHSIASKGGSVTGVIPRALIEREQNGGTPDKEKYGETIVVDHMHTRKRIMGQKSDAFVALAGGFGTAEELFELTTWNQLGIHEKPIIIVNTNGFYDGLIAWIDKAVEDGFISRGNKEIIRVIETPDELPEAIRTYSVAKERFILDWKSQGPAGKQE